MSVYKYYILIFIGQNVGLLPWLAPSKLQPHFRHVTTLDMSDTLQSHTHTHIHTHTHTHTHIHTHTHKHAKQVC